MRHHNLLILLFLAVTLSCGAAGPPGVQEGTVLARYEQALASFNADHTRAAQRQFEALLVRPDLPADLRDNCSYWLGETLYARHSWLEALACFLKVLEHPQSNKEEDARLKIALCWKQLDEPARACREARALLSRFPTGEGAPRARRLLEQCRGRG